MMELYILRHGIAEDNAPSGQDKDRQLTDEGREKTREIAHAMEELGLQFDLILTSPFPRALQTAEIVAEVLRSRGSLKISKQLASGAGHLRLLEELLKVPAGISSLLMVGHEPELSRLISLLISGEAHAGILLKKAGFCKLRFDQPPGPGTAFLEWLLSPRLMSRML